MNHIEEYYSHWRCVACPSCKTDNWLYDSHSLRAYPRIPDGCKCYSCENKFFVGSQYEFESRYLGEIEDYGIEKTIAEYLDYDTGQSAPGI